MIQYSKQADEIRAAGTMECWCLHGAVGMAADWRGFAKNLAVSGIGSRAVDLWRFLECDTLPLPDTAKAINAEAGGEISRSAGKSLLGYSMGGRLALHALLEKDHPWQAAVIVSGHPGLEIEQERADRRTADAAWAIQALTGNWQTFLDEWNRQPVLGVAPIRASDESNILVMRRREIARSFIDWSLGAQRPMWERLHEIHVPVLWIAGENDPKFLALARRAETLNSNIQIAIAPGVGHRVPWEAEDWLKERVAHFLRTAL